MAKRTARGGPDGELTAGQLELMDLVWERGEVSAADAHAALAARRPVAPTTVLTTLRRLEARGFLVHRVVGRAHLWRATRDRRSSLGAILRRLRDVAFGGSTEGLVAHLLDAGDVTPDEVRRLRRRLARHGKKGGPS